MAKLHAAHCPTCGANIQVPPNVPSIQCRYCSNVITVAHQKPPPTQMPGIPSTTLYIDPPGDWTGTGPVITSAGHNCKIHISHAKLKGTTLLKSTGSNVELTLEDVTVETTELVVQSDSKACSRARRR